MVRGRRQVGRVLAAAVAVVALAGGCGSGPSQVGSAVIVGSDAVPTSVVQSRLDVALSRSEAVSQLQASGIGAPEITRDIVTRAVLHELLQRAAADEGIVVTEAEVDQELAANGGPQAVEQSLYDLQGLRDRLRDRLIAIRYAEKYVGRLAVTADLLAATSRADAEDKARVLAAGGPAADALFTDPTRSQRGQTYRADTDPGAASTVLFGVGTGTTVLFQPSPQQSSWIVARVTERRTDAPPAADDAAAGQLGESDLVAIGERLLQPLGQQVGVRVNPRYGVWDPIQMRVVGEDEVAGVILPPSAA